jgi:hypothetical protein
VHLELPVPLLNNCHVENTQRGAWMGGALVDATRHSGNAGEDGRKHCGWVLGRRFIEPEKVPGQART